MFASQQPSSAQLGHRCRAFTLVEVLVISAITVLLVGLSTAAVQRARAVALRGRCANHLRQVGLALHQYHDTLRQLPPGVSYNKGKDPYPFMSWQTRLLPFIEQEALWQLTTAAFAQDPWFLNNPPHVGLATVMAVFTCPGDDRTRGTGKPERPRAMTSFLGVEGYNSFRTDGVLFLDSRIRLSNVTDGTSQTLMVGERPPSADFVLGWWYAGQGQAKDGSADMVLGVRERNRSVYGRSCPEGPYVFGPGRVDNQCDAFHYWSLHPGGAHFLTTDGAVRMLKYSAAPLMPALASRSGGEPDPIPD